MKHSSLTLHSKGLQDTFTIGKRIAKNIHVGNVIGLIGELGSGKTYLTKAMATELGVEDHTRVCSPTYTIINEYRGRHPIYHIDFYRLNSADELFHIGIEEYLYGNGVTFIEWANKFPEFLPEDHIDIIIRIEGGSSRSIEITCNDMRQFRKIKEDMKSS